MPKVVFMYERFLFLFRRKYISPIESKHEYRCALGLPCAEVGTKKRLSTIYTVALFVYGFLVKSEYILNTTSSHSTQHLG